ncbi:MULTISPECIES: peptide deformylase [Lichenihabitans]|uniref:peptide deformylase n=1 Tax=Lichenihabitans TaxID=2723776 RepID=UPI00103622A3|nr:MULTISPECIES: peptide deformylase [Lichenihabitans]UDL95942.1 peptide deformylase [Lichenihabitans sp. PAMC28606]
MAVLPVVTLPDSKLRQPSALVTTVDASVRALLDDMIETMYDAPGIGLAAVQIGVMQRLVVIDTAKEDEPRQPLFLVNPEITWRSEETSSYEEGCLSIPDDYYEVTRPERVRVTSLDRNGEPQHIEADGILATVLQHEIDHLDGVLFIDHISKLKRDRVIKKFEKAARIARENGRPFNPREGDRPEAPERTPPRRSMNAT